MMFSVPAMADREKARAAYDHAVKQYNLGEYQASLDGFTIAYNEFPDPRLLYNLAQCNRMLGQKQKAITLYKSYLRESGDAPPNVDEVKRIISMLEQDVMREQASKQSPPHGVEPPPPQPAPVTTPPTQPPPSQSAATQSPSTGGMPTLRKAGIGALAGGVVVAVIGVGLGASAPGIADVASHAATLSDAKSQHDRAVAFNTAGWSLAGVGAAVAVAGVVLIALPHKSEHVQARLGPTSASIAGLW